MKREYKYLVEHGHGNADVRGQLTEHVLVASRALGRALPKGTVVHHVNEDTSYNAGHNLVIFQNDGEHMRAHRRMRARKACGHASWRRCVHCGQWDDPDNLYISPNERCVVHRDCSNKYSRKNRNKHLGQRRARARAYYHRTKAKEA